MTPTRPRPLFSSKKDATLKARKMALKGDAFRSRLDRDKSVSILEEEKRKRQKAERARSQGKQYTLEKIALKAYASKAGLPPLKPQALHDQAQNLHQEKARVLPFLRTDLALDFSIIPNQSGQYTWSVFFNPAQVSSAVRSQPRNEERPHGDSTAEKSNGGFDTLDDPPQQHDEAAAPQDFVMEDIDHYRDIVESAPVEPWLSRNAHWKSGVWAEWRAQEDTLSQGLLVYQQDPAAGRERPWREMGEGVRYEMLLVHAENMTFVTHGYGNRIEFHSELVSRGYIPGKAGLQPVCFSVEMPRLYMHDLMKGQTSREGWTKALCNSLGIAYINNARQILSDALELYTRLVQINDVRVKEALRTRTTPSPGCERIADGLQRELSPAQCPSCLYELVSEAGQHTGKFFTIDGNLSFSRYRIENENVTRQFDDQGLRIDAKTVAQFEDPVGAAGARTREDGCGTKEPSVTAAEDRPKRPLTQTGLFPLICRHGFVWSYIDMEGTTGEPFKYGKAMVGWLIENGLGEQAVVGYDTGCTLGTSAKVTSRLKDAIEQHGIEFVVGSWHGWAHSRDCQLDYHVALRDGMGLEDMEGCERWFSFSNKFAALTKEASEYFRGWMLFHMIQFWNREKYGSQGYLIRENVKNACKRLDASVEELSALRTLSANPDVALDDAAIAQYIAAEKSYMLEHPAQDRHRKRDEIRLRASYIRSLKAFYILHDKLCPPATDPSQPRTQAAIEQALSVCPLSRKKRYVHVLSQVRQLEQDLGISEGNRWERNGTQWQEHRNSEDVSEFLEALDKLEVTCVARHLETQKMNRVNTGAHQRQNIQKNMQERSKAVKNQINDVNWLGEAIGLRPNLSFDSVTGEDIRQLFVVLGDLRPDGAEQPAWTKSSCKEAVQLYLEIRRAKEELLRLASEWRRLHIWIQDRERQFETVIDRHAARSTTPSPLSSALRSEYTRIKQQHRAILKDLKACEGVLVQRTGMSISYSAPVALPPSIFDSPPPQGLSASTIMYPSDIDVRNASWGFRPRFQERRGQT